MNCEQIFKLSVELSTVETKVAILWHACYNFHKGSLQACIFLYKLVSQKGEEVKLGLRKETLDSGKDLLATA